MGTLFCPPSPPVSSLKTYKSLWSTKTHPPTPLVCTPCPQPQAPTHTLQQIQGLFGVQPLPPLLGVAHGLPEFPLRGAERGSRGRWGAEEGGPQPPGCSGRSPQETSTPQSPLRVSTRRPPSCPWRGVGRGRLGLRGQSPASAQHPRPRPRSPPLQPRPGPSHRRSTRSSASSCHSSWRHRRSRSAWASEPSGRKSLGPCDR